MVQIYATTIASPSVDRELKRVGLRAFIAAGRGERRAFDIFVKSKELLARLNLQEIVGD